MESQSETPEMPQETQDLPSNRSMRNKTRITMIIYIFGMVLIFSANNSLRNLQSSLNIEGGLGTASLSVMTGASMLFGVLAAPVVMPYVRAKQGILLADATFLLYVAANFHPDYGTLIPASFLNGVGKNVYWLCVSKINIYFAYRYLSYGKKGLLDYVGHISGYFYCGFLSTQLFGNLIPYVVFKISASQEPLGNSTINGNTTFDEGQFSVADYCGANDCQDSSVTSGDQYQPASQAALYYVMGIFAVLNVIGLILHVIFLPNVGEGDFEVESTTKQPNNFDNEAYLPGECDIVEDESDGGESDCDDIDISNNNDDKPDDNNNVDKSEELKIETSEQETEKAEQISFRERMKRSFNDMKALWMFYLNPMQLLLTFPYLQLGLNTAFSGSEITRGFVSCIFGVAEVGLCMAMYGAASLISAFLCGKVMIKFGRVYPIYLAYVINMGIYLFCLFWIPSESSGIGIMYGLLCFSGVVDGIYQTFSAAIVPQVFPEDADKGYNCWAVLTTLGYFIVFTWSTSICMEYKLYAHIVILCLSAVTYGVVEFQIRRRENSQASEPSSTQNA